MTQLVLEIVEGEGAGRQFELSDQLLIGREPRSDIEVADQQASRQHARLVVSQGEPVVEDLESRNGTYVNGQIVHGRRTVAPGDQLRVGLTVLELRSQEQVAARPSAVRPRPDISSVGDNVLQPVATSDLPAPADPAAGLPEFMTESSEPAFVPEEAVKGLSPQRGGYDALAGLVDARVKRQTSVAAFALLAIAALAVIIYFGVR
jgi:pSer/pThr/pTyr-binding forkhead associated (FHA) protein